MTFVLFAVIRCNLLLLTKIIILNDFSAKRICQSNIIERDPQFHLSLFSVTFSATLYCPISLYIQNRHIQVARRRNFIGPFQFKIVSYYFAHARTCFV